MNEHDEPINQLYAKVATHSAQITEIRHQIGRVSNEVHETSNKIDVILHGMAEIKTSNAALSAKSEARPKDQTLYERLQTILVVGAIVSGSVAAISYVVDGRNGARFAVLEHRVNNHESVLKERASAIKFYDKIESTLNRRLKQNKFTLD